MSEKIDTSAQFLEFYKKKGDKKTLELLNQAYAMYQKGNCTEDMLKTKQKFQEIKNNYFNR